MEVELVSEISKNQLLEKLRQVPLRVHRKTFPYLEATFSFENIDPNCISPVQFYLVESYLERQKELRRQLMKKFSLDTFQIDKGYVIQNDDKEYTLVPPIVEESYYDEGMPLIIMDGAHRFWLALHENKRIKSIVIRDVDLPYYGKPIPEGWSGVRVLDSIPNAAEKRKYRMQDPNRFYNLYRDLSVLGVGAPREATKK